MNKASYAQDYISLYIPLGSDIVLNVWSCIITANKIKGEKMTLSVAQLENALAIRTKIDKLESIINRLHKQLRGVCSARICLERHRM